MLKKNFVTKKVIIIPTIKASKENSNDDFNSSEGFSIIFRKQES